MIKNYFIIGWRNILKNGWQCIATLRILLIELNFPGGSLLLQLSFQFQFPFSLWSFRLLPLRLQALQTALELSKVIIKFLNFTNFILFINSPLVKYFTHLFNCRFKKPQLKTGFHLIQRTADRRNV